MHRMLFNMRSYLYECGLEIPKYQQMLSDKNRMQNFMYALIATKQRKNNSKGECKERYLLAENEEDCISVTGL